MTRVFSVLLTVIVAASFETGFASAAPKAMATQCRDAKGHVTKCKAATLEPLCRVNRTFMKCSKVPHKGGSSHNPKTKN